MCFYDKTKSKEQITLKQLKYYLYIKKLLFKKNINIDFILVGSENNKSRNTILNAGFTNNEYYEFNQKKYNSILKIIEKKYLFAWNIAIKKYPKLDILLTNGSSDFIPINFFINIHRNYNPNIPYLYGINGFKKKGNIILVNNNINNKYILKNINHREIYNFNFLGGIYGFSKKLLENINNNLILPEGNEYELEKYLMKFGNPVINYLTNFFVNYKIDNSECTSFDIINDLYNIEKYNNDNSEINNFLEFINNI